MSGGTPNGVAEGAAAAHYRSLRNGCVLIEEGAREVLEVTGEDRARFIHGLVTCEVGDLEPGGGAYGFFTSPQGRILADVVVAAEEDRLRLVLPAGVVAEIGSHLAKYVVADRVEIAATRGLGRLLLAGPGSAALLSKLGVEEPGPENTWRHLRSELLGEPLWLLVETLSGIPTYALWVEAARADTLKKALLEAGAEAGLVEVEEEALEVVRVEEGRPRFGRDFGTENLPQETGLDEAVSYTKGCYLGQEIVARIHYRGQPGNLLRGLLFDGDRPPAPGAVLRHEGHELARVGSAVLSPRLGRPIGLAILPRRAAEAGTALAVDPGGTASVVELPFPERG